jgi:hypothetical protein
MIRRGAGLVALAGPLLLGCGLVAGCGKSGPGPSALASTEHNLDQIRSGTLSLLLLASPSGAPEGTGAGFRVDGPFAVGTRKGSLPMADLRYTRITGDEHRVTRFVSTGTRAFVDVDGTLTELTESQLSGLRVRDEASPGGLDGLTLTSWLRDAKVAPGPLVDGVATDKVTGAADAVAILNDVIGLTEQFGAAQDGLKRLEGEAADRVRHAVAAARAEVVTGSGDRLLRRADATVDLAVTDQKVRDALGDLAGARLVLTLEVTNLNKPVQVTEPQRANRRP